MDFSAIFQLRTKKFWWMDVIFYFVVSLLVATVICYFIFLTKNNLDKDAIKIEAAALQTVGTSQQKEYEKEVINYQKKIGDFSNLLKNYEFASNVFAFMEAQTMPNIWFKQFNLDRKNSGVQLSGESDDMDAFSRQVAILEKNKYVKNVGTLNSSLGSSAKIEFNINLALDQSIFSYLYNAPPVQEAVAISDQLPIQPNQTNPTNQTAPIVQTAPTGNSPLPPPTVAVVTPLTNGQQTPQAKSSEKLMISFHILLNPEVVGTIENTNHTVSVSIPYGVDVDDLIPKIIVSPSATVSPASDVPQSFASPVTYRVIAEDGSIQNYEVTVNILPQVVNKTSQSEFGFLIIIILAVVIIAILVAIFLFIWKKRQDQKIKP